MSASSRSEPPAIRLRDGYDVSDILLVATGVVFLLLLVQHEDEPFLFISVSAFLFLCLSLFFRTPWIQRLHAYLNAETLPWVSLMHLMFWYVQLIFTLLYGTVHHAIQVHQRQHQRAELFRGIWIVLGFTAGFLPGSWRVKLMEFALSLVAIMVRQVALALIWERSQAEPCRPVEVVANALPAFARDMALRAAAQLSRLSSAAAASAVASAVASPPDLAGCCVEADGRFACAEPRISVEIVVGGFMSLGVAAFVGLCLGIIARSKWEAAQIELKERRKELAALHSHAVALEASRREALVREKPSQRGRRPLSQPPLQPLGERGSDSDEDDLATFPGDDTPGACSEADGDEMLDSLDVAVSNQPARRRRGVPST